MSIKPQKRGPKPEVLKAEGVNWKDAIAHALQKDKPDQQWKEADEDEQRERKEKGQQD